LWYHGGVIAGKNIYLQHNLCFMFLLIVKITGQMKKFERILNWIVTIATAVAAAITSINLS
jgi:hypothetical protein